jgi:hypothetical protein
MKISWISNTDYYSLVESSQLVKNNDEYESGKRDFIVPYPDYHPDDARYKMISKQFFASGPKIKFIKTDKYIGYYPGYIFQRGDKGVGYYIDPLIIRQIIYG